MRAMLAATAILLAAPAMAEPLAVYHGRLFVAARVNGVATEALLDSGAEASLVDPRFAGRAKIRAGEPIVVRGSGGAAPARIATGVSIEALGQRIEPEAIVITDLTALSKRLIGRPVEAIVGRELFDGARLRIDIARGEIDAVDSAQPLRGQRLSLIAQHGIETIPVTVNGLAVRAEFDLGNGSRVLVGRALAHQLKLRSLGREPGGGIGGEVKRELVRIQRLYVAGKEIRDIVAAIDDQDNAADLNVGTAVLRNFIITADFRHRAVWLDPLGGKDQ